MLRICVNSQTPLVWFKINYDDFKQSGSNPIPLSIFRENEQYQFTPGGVSRMLYSLLKEMRQKSLASAIYWVSLNPRAPKLVTIDGITLLHIHLLENHLRNYGRMKEKIWQIFHGLAKDNASLTDTLRSEMFKSYELYNKICSEAMLKLHKEVKFDIFYIHDFQQLLVGKMLGKQEVKMFRLHIPLDENMLPADWKAFLVDSLKHYNAIIVSTKNDMDALLKIGYEGKIYRIYPCIDPKQYKELSEKEVNDFCARFGIRANDKLVLVVARMDPIKGQDTVLKAVARIKKQIPETKVLFVGNGSFSSSKLGLGLAKGSRWRAHLENLSKELGLQDNVIFTGYLKHKDLEAAYMRCDVNILPSRKEGFGVTVVEGWLYEKPAIVSLNAGVSELIEDGENGILFRPEDDTGLAEKIKQLLLDDGFSKELGFRGSLTSKKCHLQEVLREEYITMKEVIGI